MTQRAPRDRLGWLTDNGVLLIVLTTLFWGGNAVAGKLAVGNVSPLMLTCARWTISAILLLLIGWRHVRDDWPAIRKHFRYLFLAGACGFAVFNGLLYTALKYTTALNVAILQPAMPMFIFALNFLVFRLHVQTAQAARVFDHPCRRVAGGRAGRAPAPCTALDQHRRSDHAGRRAGLCGLLGGAARQAGPSLDELPDSAGDFGGRRLGAHGPGRILARPIDRADERDRWGVIAYTAIFPSIVGQGFWIRGNELLGGNRASVFLNLVPIFGAVLSVMILNETFHTYHAAALVMVIGGIVIAQNFSRSK